MDFETGWIDSDNSALVFVKLTGGGGDSCIIDTGFNRELFLPVSCAASWNLEITGEQEFVVAGGAIHPAFTALAEIDWLGQHRIVEVILHEGSDQLIGTGLLRDSRLSIDYRARTVLIERS